MIRDILGADKLRARLKKYRDDKIKGFRRGLLAAGLFVQAEAQKKTPVDTGLLRNSARTEMRGSDLKSEVVVSFSTAYAIYVHEDPDAYHEVGEYKFLEKAAVQNKKQVIDLVNHHVKNA